MASCYASKCSPSPLTLSLSFSRGLMQILIAEDSQLLKALCATIARTEVDVVAGALVNIFGAANLSEQLILAVISYEVDTTGSFRLSK